MATANFPWKEAADWRSKNDTSKEVRMNIYTRIQDLSANPKRLP